MKYSAEQLASSTDLFNKIEFNDIFNLKEIQYLQDLFADTHGVASIITTIDGHPITRPSNYCRLCKDIIQKTEKGCENCFQSNAFINKDNLSEPNIQPCLDGGLWEASAGISAGGKHIANWIIGQVRNPKLIEQQMINFADKIGVPREEFMAALNEVPVMSAEQFNKVAKMLFAFANGLTEKAYHNLELQQKIEQRKETVEELRKSELQFRSMFENSITGILITNPDGSILAANPEACRMLGRTEEEICRIGRDGVVNLADPRLAVALEEREHHKHFRGELEFVRADGSFFPVNVASSIFTSSTGKMHSNIFFQEISDRKLAENKLAKQNELLSKLTRFSIDLASFPSDQSLETYIPKRIKELTGALCVTYSEYDAEKRIIIPKQIELQPGILKRIIGLLGKQVTQVHSPVNDETYQKITNKIIGKYDTLSDASFGAISTVAGAMVSALLKADRYIGVAYIVEGKLYGTSLIAMSKHQADPSDEVLQNIAFLVAVSLRRKKAEEALSSTNWRLENIIDGTHAGTWEWNVETGEAIFNEQWAKIVGYTLSELAPININTWKNLAHPDDLKQSDKLLKKHFSGQLPYYDCECRMKHKDGHWVWIHDRGSLISRTSNGRPLMMFGTHTEFNDRKIAEKALLESELRFKKLFERHTAIMLLIDPETGLILDANDDAADFYGYSISKLRSMNIDEINMLSKEQVRTEYQNVINKKKNYFIFPHRLANGEERIVEVDSSPIDYNNQKILFSIIHDITERKLMEDAIKESEEKYRNIFSTGMDALFLINQATSEILDVNNSACELYGYSRDEMLRLKNFDMSAELDETRKATQKFINRIELRYHKKKDGTIFPVDISASIFKLNNQNIILAAIRDITERRNAEDTILKTKKQYDNLDSKIQVGVYILRTDPDGEFALEFASSRMSEMLGLSVENLLADKHAIFKAIHPDDLDGFIQLNQDGIRLNRPFNWKGRVIVDGNVKWMHFTSMPEQQENGNILWHGLVVDITERVQSEAEITLKNEELSKLNATKDKFFSIIAHDLRGPFSSLLGLTEVMVEELHQLSMEELKEFTTVMHKTAANLYRLLENLLQWARMQQGSIPFNPELHFLQKLVLDFIPLEIDHCKTKGIELIVQIEEGITVFADRNILQSTLLNLISNAVKFTRKGGKIILSAESADDKTIEISISDTGIGMSEELISNLFRIDVQTSRKGTDGEPSTGLGLLLCKEFIEKHGSIIQVKSEVGRGSTFYFKLQKFNH
jgi:PAS domain S-box-containing protein